MIIRRRASTISKVYEQDQGEEYCEKRKRIIKEYINYTRERPTLKKDLEEMKEKEPEEGFNFNLIVCLRTGR